MKCGVEEEEGPVEHLESRGNREFLVERKRGEVRSKGEREEREIEIEGGKRPAQFRTWVICLDWRSGIF